MGAKAETLRYRPGLRNATVNAPCPPMEWPVMLCAFGSALPLFGDVGVRAGQAGEEP